MRPLKKVNFGVSSRDWFGQSINLDLKNQDCYGTKTVELRIESSTSFGVESGVPRRSPGTITNLRHGSWIVLDLPFRLPMSLFEL